MIGGGSGGGAAPTPVAKARAERAGGHLAEAGNIESLGGREHVVDAPTNGIVRRIIELHFCAFTHAERDSSHERR